MNLHNTSYPATSKPEELVPSRYALKVGDIDVLVVSDGVLPLHKYHALGVSASRVVCCTGI